MDSQSGEDIQNSETTFCSTTVVDINQNTFVQTHGMYNTMSGPSYKLQPINHILGWDVDSEGGCGCVGAESMGNLCATCSDLLLTQVCTQPLSCV